MKRLLALILLAAGGCYQSLQQTESPLVAIQIQDRNGLTETITAPDRLELYQGTDFLHSQPYKKVLRVYKSDGKNRSQITTYHPSGTIWQYLEAEEMRAHGAYREWYANGQQKIEAMVIGGTADVTPGSQQDWLFDGLSQVWDEQGRLLAKIPYRNGMLEGMSVYYHSNGLPEKEIPFSQNRLEGDGFEYYPDGKLKSRSRYKYGSREGQCIGFFPSGETAWSEEYLEGLLRKASYYDPKGELFSEIVNGGGYQTVFEGEKLTSVVEIRQGRPEGRVQTFYPSGEIRTSYWIKNGKKHGEEIEYYLPHERTDGGKDPLPKLSVFWHEDAIHGGVKTWYDSGKLRSQREYCRNQKMGPALSWYRDGSIMLIEEYEEDRLIKGQYYKKSQRDPVSAITNGSGVAFLYDDEGVFLKKVFYAKGKPIDPED